MSFHKPLLTLVLVLIGALQISSANLGAPKSSTLNNDYIVGELTPNSVLAHTERVTAYDFADFNWQGLFNITRIEALDQTNGLYFWPIIDGGINAFHVRVLLFAHEIDFIINLFGEPLESLPSNDFIAGEQTPNSRLVHTERVTSDHGDAHFFFNSPWIIVKVEALDQSQSIGGFINGFSGGLNSSHVSLSIRELFWGAQIDFIVNIYAESLGPNDLIIGNLTENSILVHTERVNSSRFFDWRNTSFIVTRLEVLDQRNGFGGELSLADGGLDRRFVVLIVNSWDIEFDFIVNIYGKPVITNDVILGEITDTSSLVNSARIIDRFYQWSSPAIITLIEIIDQSNGNGGFVSYIRGGAGQRAVEVVFDIMNEYGINDFQINVFAEPITSNDFFVGERTSTSELVHRQRVIEEIFGNFNFVWRGPYIIKRIEARDQSFGHGGFVSNVYNDTMHVTISLLSVHQHSKIDFIIDLYGEII